MLRKVLLALAVAFAGTHAQAAVLTFTDRAAFQAAVASFQVDNLNDIVDGQFFTLARSDYTININSYGCSSGPGQCGNNSAQGFTYPAYVWTYAGGTFGFNQPINAFGLDFGQYETADTQVTLNGYTSAAFNGGFFGILDTDNTFTVVNYTGGGSGSLFDNVTYGVGAATPAADVPEPGSVALFAIALAGMGAYRRRK